MSGLVSYGSSDEEEESKIAPLKPPASGTPTNGTSKGIFSQPLRTNILP
jgi:hypothetical protein